MQLIDTQNFDEATTVINNPIDESLPETQHREKLKQTPTINNTMGKPISETHNIDPVKLFTSLDIEVKLKKNGKLLNFTINASNCDNIELAI